MNELYYIIETSELGNKRIVTFGNGLIISNLFSYEEAKERLEELNKKYYASTRKFSLAVELTSLD